MSEFQVPGSGFQENSSEKVKLAEEERGKEGEG
jgi:hypothetical protein